MRKLVAAAICLLSLSLSVTTGRKCINEARTRTGKKCCEQQLRRVDKALSRYTGGIVDLSKPQKFDTCRGQTLFYVAHAQTFDRGVTSGIPQVCSVIENASF